jgi:predicted RNA binding protein YcfA (HicA-like mRNA interferase family)
LLWDISRKSGAVKVWEVIQWLEADGWYLDRLKGSHRQFRHPIKPGTATVAGNRTEGERLLIAIFRPPPGVTYLVRGWAALPVLTLWLALCPGAFAATYGILTYLALSR